MSACNCLKPHERFRNSALMIITYNYMTARLFYDVLHSIDVKRCTVHVFFDIASIWEHESCVYRKPVDLKVITYTVKSLFLWGSVSVGVTIKSIYCSGDKEIKTCATSGQTSFNEAGLHLAASHRSLFHPCHSAKALPCQHARLYVIFTRITWNLFTYNINKCGLIECSWWISCFILFFIACIKFACVDLF